MHISNRTTISLWTQSSKNKTLKIFSCRHEDFNMLNKLLYDNGAANFGHFFFHML